MLDGMGGLRLFYSEEFPSDFVRRQSGALKTCRVREEAEIGSSILSQDLRTSCYKTGSEFSPLGKSAHLLEENARSC